MIPNKELILRAMSVVKPKKSAAGKLVGDVGAGFEKAKAIHKALILFIWAETMIYHAGRN